MAAMTSVYRGRSHVQKLASVALLAFLSGCAGLESAQSDNDELVYPPDESVPSERCISLSSLDSTDVIDDRNVLFYMHGKAIYRNVLPRRCFGLERSDAFSYRTNARQLCNVDTITVLQPFGSGLEDGAVCRLGLFYPVSEAEVDAIKLEAKRVRELGL